MLQYGKPQVIRSDRGPAFTVEIIQCITEMEGIVREFSAPYHPESMGLVERSNQTIQDVLNKMELKDEEWDLYLPLPQYTYNTMPRPMFPGMSSYEVFYGVVRPEFVRFTR